MSVETDRSKQPRLRSGRLCHCAATKVQDLRVGDVCSRPKPHTYRCTRRRFPSGFG
jgi:hypothetical protein